MKTENTTQGSKHALDIVAKGPAEDSPIHELQALLSDLYAARESLYAAVREEHDAVTAREKAREAVQDVEQQIITAAQKAGISLDPEPANPARKRSKKSGSNRLSAAGRKAISDAAKNRWERYRQQKDKAAKRRRS